MRKLPITTEAVLAYKVLGRDIDTRWVDWAVAMLMAGSDSPSLRILAGETPPFHHFEMEILLDRVIAELGLSPPASTAEAAIVLARLRIEQLVQGEVPMGDALVELCKMYMELDYKSSLHDFYLLRFAYWDLQESEVQHYWPDADRGNIEAIVLGRCREWLVETSSSS